MSTAAATTTACTLTTARLMLSLVASLLMGTMLVPNVEATKNTKNTVASVKKRVQGQRDYCEIGGGTLSEKKTAFGSTITHCNGGTEDGLHCVNTKKGTKCYQTRTQPPSSPSNGVVAPPTGGVVDEPTGGTDPDGVGSSEPG